jgi:hypothetical protein
MRRLLFVPLFLIGCLPSAFSAEHSVVGGYGFDWLKPMTAQCKLITQKDAERFKKCELSRTDAFGLPLVFHQCRVNDRSEFFIYSSLANCLEAFETMQANAP